MKREGVVRLQDLDVGQKVYDRDGDPWTRASLTEVTVKCLSWEGNEVVWPEDEWDDAADLFGPFTKRKPGIKVRRGT